MISSLIANSGIQILNFELSINPNDEVTKSLRFYEWLDSDAVPIRLRLEYAHYLSDQDVWVTKRSLFEEGFIDNDGNVSDMVNINLLKQLTRGVDCFAISDIESPLENLENQWIPLPFFRRDNRGKSVFGPTNWCRLKLIPKEKEGATTHYKAVLAFDTRIGNGEDNESPMLPDHENFQTFQICDDEDQLLDFCKVEYDCEWVDDYISRLTHGESGGNRRFPELKYLANYIYMVHYLQKLDVFPEIRLYSDQNTIFSNVDLVLDIGNSKTCGLLFEVSDDRKAFTKVKSLIIRDLSQPENTYDDPFSMRLAFHKADFGEMGFQKRKFVWPSILRVGTEAERLIYQARNQDIEQKEKVTNHSSPKRYLWDDQESSAQWEFIQLEGENPLKSIYLEGVSEQFNSNGSFNHSTDFGIKSSYSRRSLMTFVFLEILAQAHSQINSFDFRSEHDNFNQPRKIRKVVITCPTAMPLAEQLILRQCAHEASMVLQRFIQEKYTTQWNEKDTEVDVVPSVTDLKLKMSEIEDKKDWGYDEATCCQLVFLYAEISQRYLNNCEEYFDLYGKYRSDLPEYDKKSLTIGSIDIGGGTTDLMICSYKYDNSGKAVLTPVPLYWESFNLAGDDLLKAIIQQVIIEGNVTEEKFRGCTGVIQNMLIDRNDQDVTEKLSTFFGEDSNKMNYTARQMRKNFNVQVSIPIATKYLELTKNKSEDTFLRFEDLFPIHKPNQELLDYFEQHFGFRFDEIKWKFSLERINEIIITVFEPLLKKLSAILYAQGCDFLLLAGRPTSLHVLEELFLKLYPVSPDRVVSLNNYRVGRWYPFATGDGFFEEEKSIVAVGAMIGYLSGSSDQLTGFKLNMSEMKKKMNSTADFIGVYNSNLKETRETFISPEVNRNTVKLSGLPVLLGCKQLASPAYPSRPLYSLNFNVDKVKDQLLRTRGIQGETELQTETEQFIANLETKMPMTFKIVRQYRDDKEELQIDSVLDNSREEVSEHYFELKIQTLPEVSGYWLDSGEFTLSIRNNA